MQKGQKSVRAGIEDLLCPFPYFGVSRGAGVGSHAGTMANDIGYKDEKAPYEPYYAPCDVKCVWTLPSYGQAMWQSLNPVRFADGSIDYITFMTVHDSSFNAYPGMTLTQGDQMGNKGNKAAEGVHCHIECTKGQKKGADWHKNQYEIWCFDNEISIDDVFFFDNTELAKNSIPGNYHLKYLSDVVVEEPQPTPEPTPVPVGLSDEELLELTKRTIRGDFGNGQARKDALGSNYERVQAQVNANLNNGLNRWDNIRLF